jgi:hypothetical protein
LLEASALIHLIHEKFGVETFDVHGVSRAVDPGDPAVSLAISVVNFNGLALRTHENIVLYAWQLTVSLKFFATVNRFGTRRENLKHDTGSMKCSIFLVFIAAY